MLRLGILGSTRGTVMVPIIEAITNKELNAEIAIVASNKADAYILENAKRHGLYAQFIDPTSLSREAYDEQISKAMHEHGVQLILLIGYMKILSKPFVASWENKIINIHPSLLPAFAGGMDLNVHQEVLNAKINETGCTVHFVTDEVDGGPIVVQKRCPVLKDDTADTLKKRVQALEGKALIEAINMISKSYKGLYATTKN